MALHTALSFCEEDFLPKTSPDKRNSLVRCLAGGMLSALGIRVLRIVDEADYLLHMKPVLTLCLMFSSISVGFVREARLRCLRCRAGI